MREPSQEDAGFLTSLLNLVDSTAVAIIVCLSAAAAATAAAVRLILRVRDTEQAVKVLKDEIEKVSDKIDNLSDKLDRHAEMTTQALLRLAGPVGRR